MILLGFCGVHEESLPSEKIKVQRCFISNLMSKYRKIAFLTEGGGDLPRHSAR